MSQTLSLPYTDRAGQSVDLSALINTGFRAPAGGCYGLTGNYYEGGQFLPQSERPSAAPLRRAPSESEAAWRARDAAARAAHTERRRLNDLRPDTRFVRQWLEGLGTPTILVRPNASHYWSSVLHDAGGLAQRHLLTDEAAFAELEARDLAKRGFVWHSDFFRDMHARLTEGGNAPEDLSDKQLRTLGDIYAQEEGGRRGSKKYLKAWNHFWDHAVPPEEEGEGDEPEAGAGA